MRFPPRPYVLVGLLLVAACSSTTGTAPTSDAGDAGTDTGQPKPTPNDATPPDAGGLVVVTFDAGPCGDGVQDGTETAIDCGGMSCLPCNTDSHCKAASDCLSGVCTAAACAAPTCSDGVVNGTETGVDCGGGACPTCGTGQGCRIPTDCASDICQAGTTCVAPSCTDGMKDGTETGVDCGGTSCAACPVGQGCAMNTDCMNMTCVADICAECTMVSNCPASTNECVAPTCISNACGTNDLGNSHVLSTGQTVGDCQSIVCDGMGGTTTVADTTDVPVPESACQTLPACAGTMPSFTPAAIGTPCTADMNPPNTVCGDPTNPAIAGTCVQCNAAADCPATGNTCIVATCANNVCGTKDAAVGTACTGSAILDKVCGDPATAAGGTCVECNTNTDCPLSALMTCTDNACL